jgi:hypothetical protein
MTKAVHFLLCFVAILSAADADVLRVTTTGIGDGSSWANASSLSDALTNANDGDGLWIARGSYTNTPFTVAISNLSLYGGFTNGMDNFDDRDWDAHAAHLDGQSARRVMSITGPNTTLDGLTITNGWAQSGDGDGGGIYKSGAFALTINNCTFEENRMYLGGDGEFGGGGFFEDGSLTLSNCTFRNTLPVIGDRRYHRGLGFYAEDATIKITDCTFTELKWNTSGYYNWGAAFHIHGGSVRVQDTTFSDCLAQRSNWSSGGGGVAALSDLVVATFTNCTFVNNEVQSWSTQDRPGAGILSENAGAGGATIHVYGCTFTNQVAGRGSAIALESGSAVVEHSAFIDCDVDGAGDGGAFYVKAGTLKLLGCTVTECDATAEGGAVYNEGGTLTISNSILWANSAATQGSDVANAAGGSGSIDFCLLSGDEDSTAIISDASGGNLTTANVFSQDPLFASGSDVHLRSPAGRWNGTMFVTDAPPYSPAIDAGDPSSAFGNEVAYNGSKINLGRYGNTAEASKSTNNAPTVEHRAVTTNLNIVTLRGELVTTETIADVTFYFGTTDGAEVQGDWGYTNSISPPPHQTGTVFSATIAGLLYDQLYYFGCFATNNTGYDWANASQTFTTGPEPPGGGANVIHVDTNATTGGNTGDNWFNAFTDWSDACDAVGGTKTQMWIAAGTFTDTAAGTITDDVAIYGGFTGTETNLSQRDADANKVFLDGEGSRRTLRLTGGPIMIDGVTFTNGVPGAGDNHGGGIHKSGSFDVTITDCNFFENRMAEAGGSFGGGGYFEDGTLTFSNCTFRHARTTAGSWYARGLGFYAEDATVKVTDCTFTELKWHANGWYDWGAAFHVHGGSVAVENSTFSDCRGQRSNFSSGGGAICALSDLAFGSFTNCTFVDNFITEQDDTRDRPGVILCEAHGSGADVHVYGCTFTNNTAGKGAAVCVEAGSAIVEHSSFIDCDVTQIGEGGCFYLKAGSLDVSYSTITGCDAEDHGGAIYQESGDITVYNSILYANTAPSTEGADVYVEASTSIDLNYNNLSGDPTDTDYIRDLSGNLTQSNNITENPTFVSGVDVHLQSQDGRWDNTTSMFTNDSQTSVCIDAGDPGAAFANETAPNGGRVNLGRYGNTAEASRTPAAVTPIVTNRGSTVNFNQAEMKGELIINDATADITFYYDTSDKGEFGAWTSSEPMGSAQQTGTVFQVVVNGLAYNTTYFFRAFATNASGYHWAQNPQQFTTGGEPKGGGDGIIHVKSDATGGQNGLNWFDAFLTIQAAADAANDNTNEIWVALVGGSDSSTANIDTNCQVYGGFIGDPSTGETNRADRTSSNTVVDGGGLYRPMAISDSTVTLDQLTITNGFLSTAAGTTGAGLNATDSDVTLVNCVFANNGFDVAQQRFGGGAYFSGGSALISNCVFRGFRATTWNQDGFGWQSSGTDIEMVGCTITDNKSASGDWYQQGGAFKFEDGLLTVRDCSFDDNRVARGHLDVSQGHQSGGGAVYIDGDVIATFTGCVFTDNEVTAALSRQSPGGALMVYDGGSATVTVSQTVFDNNAGTYGGTIYLDDVVATIENCTITRGLARDGTAGMGQGGAVRLDGGSVTIHNSILWSNVAETTGSELYVTNSGNLTIDYCLLTGTNSPHVTVDSGSVNWGPGITMADPLFASTADLHLQSIYGRVDEVTQTIVQDDEQSPAIDAGDPLDDIGLEPKPNGFIINLGAYGGTTEASLSSFGTSGSQLLFR